MNQFIKTDPWLLVEERFDPARVKSSESLFALGNGVMGAGPISRSPIRANRSKATT